MTNLANNALRTENMKSLLKDMGIDLNGTEVICHDELLILNFKTEESGRTLVNELQKMLEIHEQIEEFELARLLNTEIDTAQSFDARNTDFEIDKALCRTALEMLVNKGLPYTFDENKQYIEMEIPAKRYADIFKQLKCNYLSVAGNRGSWSNDANNLRFDIKKFLASYPNKQVLIKSNDPFLVMNVSIFAAKKIFYAQKQLDNGNIEVTPYFYVSNVRPPLYHFVVDISGSMNSEIDVLKESVVKFSKALFAFQPEASIEISSFNHNITRVGTYTKNKLWLLQDNIRALNAEGRTNLYEATSLQLNKIIKSASHNNVLLFTDGVDASSINDGHLKKLEQQVTDLNKDSALIVRTRNKFFIMSYNMEQPDILKQVAKLFGTEIINANNVDLIKSLEKTDKLQEWAAARELFSCKIVIDDEVSEEYVQAFDLSDQFVSLKSQECTSGIIHLIIKDSAGTILLDDQRSLISKAQATKLAVGAVESGAENTAIEDTSSENQSNPIEAQPSRYSFWQAAAVVTAGTITLMAANSMFNN